MKLPDNELTIHTEQDEEGYWIARVFHRPSATIKISNKFLIEQEAVDSAKKELAELVAERKKGLA
jgi:hypothetical protein